MPNPKHSMAFETPEASNAREHATPPEERLLSRGPLLIVVFKPNSEEWYSRSEGQERPNHFGPAIIDTGSRLCCIDKQIAESWQLKPVGSYVYHTVSNSDISANIYDVELQILGIHDSFPVQAAGVPLSQHGHAFIIGRAFLRNWRMTYDGAEGFFRLEMP